MGGKREKAGWAGTNVVAALCCMLLFPCSVLMISDIFINTAEVKEEEKKSRGATKRNG